MIELSTAALVLLCAGCLVVGAVVGLFVGCLLAVAGQADDDANRLYLEMLKEGQA